jgi:hypothetical protein
MYIKQEANHSYYRKTFDRGKQQSISKCFRSGQKSLPRFLKSTNQGYRQAWPDSGNDFLTVP